MCDKDPFHQNIREGPGRGWDMKEDDDVLHLPINMPGLREEDIKISVNQNTLIIRTEGDNESDEKKEEGSILGGSICHLIFTVSGG